MGRATRWLRSLFGGGGKKEKEKEKEKEPGSNSFSSANSRDTKEHKRWSFGKSSRYGGGQCPVPPGEIGWMRSYYGEADKEQTQHAIAVAAATAAAADAAVAAAQAAVEVVRLTSQGRGVVFGGGRDKWAALKIQKVFRGYLARKALRALKALVKLQAHVRGYLVRKQAAATLYSMQALIRAQASVRSQRARRNLSSDHPIQPESRHRKSHEQFQEFRSERAHSFHSRQLSASMESAMNGLDESPKIVEIDTCRPKSMSKRMNASMSECGDDPTDQNLPSNFPPHIPARLSIPECRAYHELDWGLALDECRFSTAQSTPRFTYPGGSQFGMPVTPAKSVCTETFFHRYSNYPNYMANTKSFRAKLRSQSAPKQRPEQAPKKKISLNDLVESRASLSGVRMQKSCSRVQEAYSLKSAVLGKLERSCDFGREPEADYSQRRW